MLATNGKAFTLKAADLPRGRGDGQPVRLLAELTNEDDITALFVAVEGTKYLIASNTGRGFIVPAGELLAERRTGKQVLNLKPQEEAALCVPADGDHVAIIGENRKLLVFPLDQVPEMARGAGVMLQRYKDGNLSDAKVFRLADGLTWKLGDRMRTETDLRPWLAERGIGRPPAAEWLSEDAEVRRVVPCYVTAGFQCQPAVTPANPFRQPMAGAGDKSKAWAP